jgi:hypothetical protein
LFSGFLRCRNVNNMVSSDRSGTKLVLVSVTGLENKVVPSQCEKKLEDATYSRYTL